MSMYDALIKAGEEILAAREKAKPLNHPALYCLIFEDKTVYFGSTGNPRRRQKQHLSTQPPHQFKILCYGDLEHVRTLEKKYIQKYTVTGRLRNIRDYHWEPFQRTTTQGTSIRAHALKACVSYSAVRGRMKNGETLEQALVPKNRHKTIMVEFEGELWGLRALAVKHNLSYQTLQNRLKRGVPVNQAVKKF